MDRTGAAGQTIARVLIGGDGRYREADALALELLGVTADELRAHHVGDFTLPELRTATRASWGHLAQTGQTDYLIHETVLVAADGTARVVKVHPMLPGDEPSTWWARFEPLTGPRGRTLDLAQPRQVLSAWRAAERRAAGLPAGSAERERAEATAAGLGSLYRAALDLRLKDRADPGSDA